MSIDTQTAENLYLSLFPGENTVEFRNLILYVVWTSIKANPGITKSKLEWQLSEQFSFDPKHVDVAIKALSNPKMFDSISLFHKNQKNTNSKAEIIYLRPKKDSSDYMDKWEHSLLHNNPHFEVLR